MISDDENEELTVSSSNKNPQIRRGPSLFGGPSFQQQRKRQWDLMMAEVEETAHKVRLHTFVDFVVQKVNTNSSSSSSWYNTRLHTPDYAAEDNRFVS